MKTIILRTIAHNRIWEGNEPICHYEELGYNIIKKWEPDIVQKSLQEVAFGIGIYTKQYYTYRSPAGKAAYTKTEAEHKPSLLKLEPISPGNKHFGVENSNPNEIKIAYTKIEKVDEIEKDKMLLLDDYLLNEKMNELKIEKTFTKYPSLCFTLENEAINKVLSNLGITFRV